MIFHIRPNRRPVGRRHRYFQGIALILRKNNRLTGIDIIAMRLPELVGSGSASIAYCLQEIPIPIKETSNSRRKGFIKMNS
ncbi:hypothetical protein [Larkinella rosea]|uniref:Uncharacterized protein n=1 Tax=Larkinella rosea TaxID=2025312 RepID=A0A3P1C2Y1_9BACT|nr:hypothetical protein [Larkinella rosea]RRB07164.1 hypothetical protein EHT25_05120 [Larkinella rosea]